MDREFSALFTFPGKFSDGCEALSAADRSSPIGFPLLARRDLLHFTPLALPKFLIEKVNMAEFSYGNPEAAYLFLVIPVLFILSLLLTYKREELLRRITRGGAERALWQGRSHVIYWLKALMLFACYSLAIYALMAPRGNPRYPDAYKKEVEVEGKRKPPHEVLFLLDTSRSMDTKDMRGGKSRLEVAKEIIDETLRRLDGQTVSLYLFTSESDKYVPSTMDYIFTRLLTREVNSNEEGSSGTDLLRSLKKVAEEPSLKRRDKLKSLIILSDGEDIEFEEESPSKKELLKKEFAALLSSLEKNNFKIFTVAVGTKEGGEVPALLYKGEKVTSHLDPTLLRLLGKEEGEGGYFLAEAYDSRSLSEKLYRAIKNREARYREGEKEAIASHGVQFVYDHYSKTPLFAAALLLAIVLLMPEGRGRYRDE